VPLLLLLLLLIELLFAAVVAASWWRCCCLRAVAVAAIAAAAGGCGGAPAAVTVVARPWSCKRKEPSASKVHTSEAYTQAGCWPSPAAYVNGQSAAGQTAYKMVLQAGVLSQG
jgi:hypothetical protein